MSDVIHVGSKYKGLDVGPKLDGYSKVVITVSDEVEYSAGNDVGRTLRIQNPWGTQDAANRILQLIQGFQYQPYTATDAQIDPAAELGDAVNLNRAYSGLYKQSINYNRLTLSSASAPVEQVIDHEYPYVSKSEKEIIRKYGQLSSALRVQAEQITAEVAQRKSDVESLEAKLQVSSTDITAKVSNTGGDTKTFGWSLKEDSWTISANGGSVLKVDKNGAEIYGKITATSGKIGGLDIESNALTYNNHDWNGTNTTGIYIGPKGIQLGKNFKVDMYGNLTANSGTFLGNVKAANIKYGSGNGTLSGAAISPGTITGGSGGSIAASTLATSNFTAGINTSLGYADFAAGVFGGWNQCEWIVTKRFTLNDYNAGWTTIKYVDHSGNNRSVRVLVGQQ